MQEWVTLKEPPPSEGLVSWWSFEDEATDRRGENDGVLLNGAQTIQDGTREFVLELDGQNDVMEVPHSDRLNGARALTYALWVHPEAWTENAVLMSKGNGSLGQMWLGVENGQLVGRVDTDNGIQVLQSVLPETGTWSHIALIYAGNEMALYVNGQLNDQASFSFSPLLLNQEPLYIGEEVEGRIDDAVVYDIALPEVQVQELIGAVSNVRTEEEQVIPGRTRGLVWETLYPNPFQDRVHVQYILDAGSVVHAEVYDAIGRRVRSLQSAYKYRGSHTIIWDGSDDSGRQVRSGGYFIRITANGAVITTHLIKL